MHIEPRRTLATHARSSACSFVPRSHWAVATTPPLGRLVWVARIAHSADRDKCGARTHGSQGETAGVPPPSGTPTIATPCTEPAEPTGATWGGCPSIHTRDSNTACKAATLGRPRTANWATSGKAQHPARRGRVESTRGDGGLANHKPTARPTNGAPPPLTKDRALVNTAGRNAADYTFPPGANPATLHSGAASSATKQEGARQPPRARHAAPPPPLPIKRVLSPSPSRRQPAPPPRRRHRRQHRQHHHRRRRRRPRGPRRRPSPPPPPPWRA